MMTKESIVERLIEDKNITAAEAVVLLKNEVLVWGEKTLEVPDQDTVRGLLYDTPHYSPQPILPIPQPNVEKKKKACNCKECRCGNNKKGTNDSD